MLNQPPNVSLQPLPNVPQTLQYFPDGRVIRPGYNRKAAKLLGSLMIATGLCLIVFQITAKIIHIFHLYLASGFFAGIMAIIAGSFGFTSAQRQTNCLIITYMVLSIVTAVFCSVPVMVSIMGLSFHHVYGNLTLGSQMALYAMILVTAMLLIILCVWSSAVCCKTICCGPGANGYDMSHRVQYMAASQGIPQQVVIIAPPPMHAPGVAYTFPTANAPACTLPQVMIPLEQHQGCMASAGSSHEAEAPPVYCPLVSDENKAT